MDEDLKNRIDSSDQDENASYEELNDDDLKTHSSGEDRPKRMPRNQGGMLHDPGHKSFSNPHQRADIAEDIVEE